MGMTVWGTLMPSFFYAPMISLKGESRPFFHQGSALRPNSHQWILPGGVGIMKAVILRAFGGWSIYSWGMAIAEPRLGKLGSAF